MYKQGSSSSGANNTLLASVSVPELFTFHGEKACELQEKKLKEFLQNPNAVNFDIDAHRDKFIDCINDSEGGFSHKLCCLLFLNCKDTEKMELLKKSVIECSANIENYCYGSFILKILKPELCKAKIEQPLETLTLPVSELIALLDDNRHKTRRAACLALKKLMPNLTEEERPLVFDKLVDKAKNDDDLDVCLDSCHSLIALGRLIKEKDNQPVEVVFEIINDAIDHMNNLDEITYDPDQAWVLDQVDCDLISTLAYGLEAQEKEKNYQSLYRFLDAPDWQIRQSALEGLMKIGKPIKLESPTIPSAEFLAYTLYCETLRLKADRTIENKI